MKITQVTCENCRFYSSFFNECRRFPPKVTSVSNEDIVHCFPIVKPEEWCGEFKTKDLYSNSSE